MRHPSESSYQHPPRRSSRAPVPVIKSEHQGTPEPVIDHGYPTRKRTSFVASKTNSSPDHLLMTDETWNGPGSFNGHAGVNGASLGVGLDGQYLGGSGGGGVGGANGPEAGKLTRLKVKMGGYEVNEGPWQSQTQTQGQMDGHPPSEDVLALGAEQPKSGSEYNEEDAAMDEAEDDHSPENSDDSPARRRSARGATRKSVRIANDDEDEDAEGSAEEVFKESRVVNVVTRSGRHSKRVVVDSEDEDEDLKKPKRRTTSRSMGNFVVNDEEGEDSMDVDGDYGAPRRSSRGATVRQDRTDKRRQLEELARRRAEDLEQRKKDEAKRARGERLRRRAADPDYTIAEAENGEGDGSQDAEAEAEAEEGKGKYAFRKRDKVINYVIPPPTAVFAEDEAAASNARSGRNGNGGGPSKRRKYGDDWGKLPLNMTGKNYEAIFGIGRGKGRGGSPDSDDDNFGTPRKGAASIFSGAHATGFPGVFAGGAGGIDLSGTPNNLGKVSGTTNADIDPLGISPDIDFDAVGGLDHHVQQLKEMVSLPLLYPEVFQRFNITPPRGVLFHGPPGTGKTLVARALAASCSTEGQKISFFMRKGADCLSKWVGEAERQLRLLFEEAKACQPSIIFFDEIDGLAPVRSSKQEQIHASIVSTLLALMDGMDGRGQVVIIGATNRPDAIDPALRRPGRFDREFYFPLPNREARRKILDIHTKGWNPPLEDSFKDELALLSKGYGGADLRALCTEAALNSVQRRYPQIYKTNDRLLIRPETINVTARDFMISLKNLIPSTARSGSSAAAPLPEQLEPLLGESFEAAKNALAKVLPNFKKPNVLEEAEFEDEGDGSFEREKLAQSFETLRIYRPRMLICGEPGMGQSYTGAAILHHLEGYHVQSLDLGNLVSDSTRTLEAACVQLFVEAKRHKPSIIFIPSLSTWCGAVTDTVKSTVKGLLDGLDPSDPILLLAVVDGPIGDLPADVRSWFGFVKANRLALARPDESKRRAFFANVRENLRRPPNLFPDAMPRKKRVLEVLPKAPPPAPRAPTEAELQQQQQNDFRLRENLKFRLGPILNELKKRYKRLSKQIGDPNVAVEVPLDGEVEPSEPNGSGPVNGVADGSPTPDTHQPNGEEAKVTRTTSIRFHDIDLEKMHYSLYYDEYLTPADFVHDVKLIRNNAHLNSTYSRDRDDFETTAKADQMLNQVHIMIDQAFEPQFHIECERMAAREKERLKRKKGKGKETTTAPTRQSARSSGRPPEFGLSDVVQLERKLKRQRRDSESPSGGEEGRENGSKRHKADGVNGVVPGVDELGDVREAGQSESQPFDFGAPRVAFDLTGRHGAAAEETLEEADTGKDGNFEAGVPVAPIVSEAIVGSDYQLSHVPTSTNLAASGSVSIDPAAPLASNFTSSSLPEDNLPSHHDPAKLADLTDIAVDVSKAFEAEPEPEPEPIPEVIPEFVIDDSAVSRLERILVGETGSFNVDQLEQLRAACYDRIWSGRKEWDRRPLVEELCQMGEEMIQDASEMAMMEM